MTSQELPNAEGTALCLRIAIEEGLFAKRLLFHRERYPKSSPQLTLIATPFLALIAHSMPSFLQHAFHWKVKESPAAVKEIRHRMKSLDLEHITFEEYSRDVHEVFDNAHRGFAGHGGLLGLLRDRLVPDVGVTYYARTPIYSTTGTAYNLYGSAPIPRTPELSTEIGFCIGQTLAPAVAMADSCFSPESAFVPEFVTSSNDLRLASLVGRFSDYGYDGVTAFFLLSERMTTLSSVKALRQGGFLEDVVWMKFETVALYHTYKALSNLVGSWHRPGVAPGLPEGLISEIQGLTTHAEKQVLKRMRRLRNAFIHYDFGPGIVPVSRQPRSPSETLQAAIVNTVGMSYKEYEQFLLRTHEELVLRLQRLLSFPEYSVWRDPGDD